MPCDSSFINISVEYEAGLATKGLAYLVVL
jgi:hypothetical protein